MLLLKAQRDEARMSKGIRVLLCSTHSLIREYDMAGKISPGYF
jgi:hypothetical protein